MATDDYRIDPVEHGQFQVRVRQNPGGEAMWFDAGDPCDTRAEAEAKMAEFKDFGGHKAEPLDPRDRETGVSKCRFCSGDIHIVPGGDAHPEGKAWVHADGHIVSFK